MDILIPIFIFAGIGIGAGLLLSIFSNVFAVKTDQRVEQLKESLPGLNCGACGFSGCESYAEALAKDSSVQTNLCTPGGALCAQMLSDILGTSFQEVEPIVAEVYCQGTCEKTSNQFDYEGLKTCVACNGYYKGKGQCHDGCLGFGDCKNICPFDAIQLVDGIAMIDPHVCTGCGMCVDRCPKGIIGLHKKTQMVTVRCMNQDVGRYTRMACSVGCIGCKKCEKSCPSDAIHVINHKAIIDPEQCTNCERCVDVCPVKCIVTKCRN